jgi:hypothetical protein
MESASQRVPAPFPLRLESLEPVGMDVKQLRKLIAGEGISEEALDGLVEKCTKCRRYFMVCALKALIRLRSYPQHQYLAGIRCDLVRLHLFGM